MKNLNKIWFLGLALFLVWGGCKKDDTLVVLNPNAQLVATLSATTLTLSKDNPKVNALTINWVKPDFGFAAVAAYTVYVDKKGNNFAKPIALGVGSDLKKAFNALDLNSLIIGLGVPAGTSSDLDFRVDCLIGSSTVLSTIILNAKVTTYVDKLDLTSAWGVVGDATLNGWNGPDLPMYKSGSPNELVAYVTVNDGQIKFRRYNDWGVNLGSSGTVEPDPAPTGGLALNGKNLGIKKGSYKISVDTIALKYKVETYSWGIVGDATLNGWNGPDLPLTYDANVDLWRGVITVNAGQIKFRKSNDWAENYGATGSVEPAQIGTGGGLAAGGKNFGVTAGTYLVTLDLKGLKYTFAPYKPIGIVGDATPNGWNGPDTQFTYDLSTKMWVLSNLVLKDGQIKFRENNAWDNNWGSSGSIEPDPIAASGALKNGGKNFGVTAGTWSFVLDLSDSANPKYKATKK